MGSQCASPAWAAQAACALQAPHSNVAKKFPASVFNIKVLYNSLVVLVEGRAFCGQAENSFQNQRLESIKTLCVERLVRLAWIVNNQDRPPSACGELASCQKVFHSVVGYAAKPDLR
jgi:hypothetical protein